MDQLKGQIGFKEFFAIIVLTIGTKLGDDTPTLFYSYLDTAGWMAPIIIGAASILPLLLLHKTLDHYRDKNLAEIIRILFGKYVGFILLLILFAISLSSLTVDSAIYANLISTMYFTKTPVIVLYGLSMALCVFAAKKGIQLIGSVSWALLLWIKITLVIVLGLLLVQGEINFIFPIFGPGEIEVIKQSVAHSSIFAELLYFAMIFPFIADNKKYKKAIWFGLLLIILEMTVALFGYVMLFDFVGVKEMNYPFHEALRYFEIGFLINVETFFFPFWLIAAFLRFIIYLYFNALIFCQLFHIKEINFVMPIIAALIVILGMIPDSPTYTLIQYREIILFITSPIFLTLPILIWIARKIKGVNKHETYSS